MAKSHKTYIICKNIISIAKQQHVINHYSSPNRVYPSHYKINNTIMYTVKP